MTATYNPGYYLEDGIAYPERDGNPMSDNTKQFNYIVLIKEGLEALFRHDPDVFVAGDFLWYPVRGDNKLRVAPDTMVVFGRPKGDRGSYLQWLEENIPPQVVFEILSPGNTRTEMSEKKAFYELYGVEEYYVYDPDRLRLEGYLRQSNRLEQIAKMSGWVSPRLGIRFEMEPNLELYRPDGSQFVSYSEVLERAEEAELQATQAQEQRQEAEARMQQERQQRQEAEAKMQQEQQQRQEAETQAEQARQRAERLATLLRENGISFDE